MSASVARGWLSRRLERTLEPARLREQRSAEALRAIAAATRAGHSLPLALDAAALRSRGCVTRELARAAARIRLGLNPGAALHACATELKVSSWFVLADVVSVQHRRGGDLAVSCQRVAQLLHERGRLEREAASLTAQARFTARTVLALPLFGVVLWLWRSPASFERMMTPGMLLAASPALVSISLGIYMIRRFALRGASVDVERRRAATAGGHISRLLRCAVGTGSIVRQSTRGAAIGSLPALLVLTTAGHVSTTVIFCAVIALGCGAAWPTLDQRRAVHRIDLESQDGLCALLEISLALLAAGATPHEVVTSAVASCPGMLGERLRAGGAMIELGRTPVSALGSQPVVLASPALEAWLQSLTSGARQGAPATQILETLLRDARASEREFIRSRAATIGPRIQLAVVAFVVPAITWLVLLATASGLAGQLRDAGVLASG